MNCEYTATHENMARVGAGSPRPYLASQPIFFPALGLEAIPNGFRVFVGAHRSDVKGDLGDEVSAIFRC